LDGRGESSRDTGARMKLGRPILLATSIVLSLVVLGGGIVVKVRAQDNSYRNSVIFAEVMSLVLENYVDSVEGEDLLRGAYEGLLAGLDPNGAYLTAEEVLEWKAGISEHAVDPGISVLKLGRMLQIVALDPGSPAEEADLEVGDQIRSIDGRQVTDLSLGQCRRLIEGAPGTPVVLEVLQRGDEFEPTDIEVVRAANRGRAYSLVLREGVAVLRLADLSRVMSDALSEELDDVRSRGVERLLIDVRNLADDSPRDAVRVAALFAKTPGLVLKDRAGELLDSVEGEVAPDAWPGPLSVLANGATAGGGEAFVRLLQVGRDAEVFGESTFGLGAEPKLLELENGAGLLVSFARWETSGGEDWNEDGVEPDREVRGRGDSHAEAAENQLSKVLELLESDSDEEVEAA